MILGISEEMLCSTRSDIPLYSQAPIDAGLRRGKKRGRSKERRGSRGVREGSGVPVGTGPFGVLVVSLFCRA